MTMLRRQTSLARRRVNSSLADIDELARQLE
jgi:hypothetical protein